MSMLGYARNICAHDERFYDIRFSQRLHTKSIKNFNLLNLPRDRSGSYTKGTCDAFAIAIIFSQLLSKSDLREFASSMDNHIIPEAGCGQRPHLLSLFKCIIL